MIKNYFKTAWRNLIKRKVFSIINILGLTIGIAVCMMIFFVFIENGKAFTKSTAALKVCRYLSGLWPLLYGFIVIPAFIRNAVYDFIAKNRYKWFGVQQQCMIPTPEVRARFLS